MTRIVLAILGTLLLAVAASAQSVSPSWRLQQSTVNGGGDAAAGPSRRITVSLGQESTIGVASGNRHVLQSGFWSWAGSGLVPVILFAKKNAIDPGDPDLYWTGNGPPYVLYGTTNCPDVTSGFLATTPDKLHTDTAPPVAPLVCYSVFATAPGPIAPVGGAAPTPEGEIGAR